MTNNSSSICASYPRNLAIPHPNGAFINNSSRSANNSAMFMLETKREFPTDNSKAKDIARAIRRRFDKLPIHKICYNQSCQSTEVVTQKLRKIVIAPGSIRIRMFCNRASMTGNQQDCFGMTALHILACSLKHDVRQYQLLIEHSPESLITKDTSGGLPLLYALWGNAPRAVIKLLVDRQRSLFPEFALNFPEMIEMIGRARYAPGRASCSLACIKKVMNTKQSTFSDHEINWQEVITVWVAEDTKSAKEYNYQRFHHDTFKYLMRTTIMKRLSLLGVKTWQQEILTDIDKLCWFIQYRKQNTDLIYSRLAHYEQLSKLREAMASLELALWKAKYDSSSSCNHVQDERVSGPETNPSQKDVCHVKCGADVIVPNVLSFLLPAKEQN